MKYIIAIIQPDRLSAVKDALNKIKVFRLTVSKVKGAGQQKGWIEKFKGHEYKVNLLDKIKLELAVSDEFVQPTIDAITNAARTGEEGEIGDGKIFILPLEDVVRIRTKESGASAI